MPISPGSNTSNGRSFGHSDSPARRGPRFSFAMIRFDSVTKTFGNGRSRVLALQDLNLAIPAGEMCAIVGPSGAGKSTVLHLAAGLTTPDRGAIRIPDRELTGMSVEELTLMRRREVATVFQFFNLLPYLTAW